jgi:N-acyl-D-aspartate/D-glutamate deacylase
MMSMRRDTFDHTVFRQIHSPKYKAYEGRVVGDIAREEGRRYADVLLDVALTDDLETELEVRDYIHANPEIVAVLLSHPGLQIGSGDAGAHVAQFCGAGDTCYLIERFVRELGLFTLEQAIKRLTSDLASAWSIQDRGELAVGKYADLVVFDPRMITRGQEVWVQDLPGGGGRFVRRPRGIHQVIVNGQIVVNEGTYTDARPGRII